MKYILIILFTIGCISSFAQLPEIPRSGANVMPVDYNLYVASRLSIPLDTATDAKTGSFAYKGGVWYGKLSTHWQAFAAGTGITKFFDLSDIDSTGMRDGYLPYYDLTSGNIKFIAPGGEIVSGNEEYFVEDSTNTPPVSFPVGIDTTYWLVGGSPTGAWTGEAYKIAMYVNGVLDGFITGNEGDYATTLDDGVRHRYNLITWPVTYARQWNTNGNYAGGILGSSNPANVYLRYNNIDRIRLSAGGVFFPKLNGTDNAIATFNSAGLIQRREPVASTDTTANKPIGQAADGTIYRMGSWPGGGGGGSVNVYAPLVKSGDTISRRFNVLHYGADPTGVADATIAIQNAINAAIANKGGTVYIPNGAYKIAGALVTSSGGHSYNSQIIIPVLGVADTSCFVIIEGESPINWGDLYTNPGSPGSIKRSGVVLFSTISSFSGTKPAIIGGSSNGTLGNYSQIYLTMINIAFEAKHNPSGTGPVIGGLSYLGGLQTNLYNCAYYTDTASAYQVEPQNNIAGFENGNVNANGGSYFQKVFVTRCFAGIVIGEHTVLDQVDVNVCKYSFVSKTGYHAWVGERMKSHWSTYDFYVLGESYFHVPTLDIEYNSSAEWYDNVATIKDSANIGYGDINYHMVQQGVGINYAGFSKSGGSNIRAYPIVGGLPAVANTFAASNLFRSYQTFNSALSGFSSALRIGTNHTSDGYFALYDTATLNKIMQIGPSAMSMAGTYDIIGFSTANTLGNNFSTEKFRISAATGNAAFGGTLVQTGTATFNGNGTIAADKYFSAQGATANTTTFRVGGDHGNDGNAVLYTTSTTAKKLQYGVNIFSVMGGYDIAGYTTAANLGGIQTNLSFRLYSTAGDAGFLGGVNIGSTSAPTARLQLPAGGTAANTAPQKWTTGSLNTTIVAYQRELNTSFYSTNGALNRYAEGGAIADFTADGNNSGTSETDLQTYTTKANTLNATGEKLVYEAGGTFNDVTATGQLQFYFAGTSIGNTGTLTISATGGWSAKIIIIRTGASTARSLVSVTTPGASTAVYTTETDLTGLTFSGTNIIKITGTAGGGTGGSSDITSKLGSIFWWPAANN